MLTCLMLAACDNLNDPTAPEDSTITVSANPQTVVIMGGGSGITTITATLRASNGTRLPDQEVTFSTTAGALTPPAQTPLKTNSAGQVISTLTTSSAATVTASSGSITGQTQIQTAAGNISAILLGVDSQVLTSCGQVLTVTASVIDTIGTGIPGVPVIFTNPMSTVTGSFSPGPQVASDASGNAVVTWMASASSCNLECEASGGMGTCTLFFRAEDITGSFQSVDVEVIDMVP